MGLSTLILWWFNMSVLLSGLSPLLGSMGFVGRSPYCGSSSNTWREVTSSDGQRIAVKDELGIGRRAKNWALIGGWRPPGRGRRSNEVGPLMTELRKGGQVSDRPSEAEMKKHAPPLDVKQELSSDEGYMGWEDNEPMPGFFLNQDLATSAGRPLPEVITFGGIGTIFRQKDPMCVLLRTELLRAHPGARLPSVVEFDREIKNTYKHHDAIRPNFGATCGLPASEWWYNVLWEATASVMKKCRYPMIDEGIFNEVVDKLYFEAGAGNGQWELMPGVTNVLERLAYWSRETGDALPSAGMFNEVLRRSGVESSQMCLHVGADTHLDYFAALNAGWQAIKVGLLDFKDLNVIPKKGYKSSIFDIRFLPENLGLDEDKPDLNLDAPREGVHNGEYWDPILHFDDANMPDTAKKGVGGMHKTQKSSTSYDFLPSSG